MATKQKKPSVSSGGSKSPRRPAPTSSQPGRTLTSKVSSTSAPSPKASKVTSKPTQPTGTTSTVTQADDVAARLSFMRSSWERVAGTVALAALFDTLENVTSNIDQVGNDVANVRARGYRFGRAWESQMETLRGRWSQQHAQALQLLDNERRVLQGAARDVELLVQRASRDASLIPAAEGRVSALESNVRQAQMRVRGTFDRVQQQTNALQAEIQQAKYVLDALDSASFPLLPDEHPVAACEATWVSDAQSPEGLLFLTDARLVFEQRQEVAKKKILFITTEKELIKEKLWESPIGAVEETEAEDQKAFLRRKELLTLRFSERTRETPGDVTLQLKNVDNDAWRVLIRKAKAGELDSDRLGAAPPEQQLVADIEQEQTAPPKELPTRCPNCNAPLPAIFKGMRQVTCDYCGMTINV